MKTATAGTKPCKKCVYILPFECRNSVNLFSMPIGLKTYTG